jgi:hypothetical protein
MKKLWQKLNQLLQKERQVSVENKQEGVMYTEEQLMARLKFFIGICLALTLVGIVFVVLYSLIFVTQPMNAIAPIDQKFFELIIPIATFLTGTLSGIMLAGNDKDLRGKAIDAASGVNKPGGISPTPSPVAPMPSPVSPVAASVVPKPVVPGIAPPIVAKPPIMPPKTDQELL